VSASRATRAVRATTSRGNEKGKRRRMPAEQRRAAILEVAREAFIRDGYRSATALSIAREAGVSEGLVLKHFGTKEQLFRCAVIEPLLAIIDQEANETLARVTEARLGSVHDDYESTRDFMRRWVETLQANGALLLSLLAEAREFKDAIGQIAGTFEQHIGKMGATIQLAAQRAEYGNFDATATSYMAIAAATLAALAVEDTDKFIDSTTEVIFSGILSPTGRRALSRR